MIIASRRSFLVGLSASLVAAPAIVRAASLMPVRGIIMPTSLVFGEFEWGTFEWSHVDGTPFAEAALTKEAHAIMIKNQLKTRSAA